MSSHTDSYVFAIGIRGPDPPPDFTKCLAPISAVAAAAQAAQQDLIAKGAPAAAWAGIVVLGDGDLVPLPGGRKGWNVPAWAWMLGLVVLAVLVVFWIIRSRSHGTALR